jgi:hypothetical protein
VHRAALALADAGAAPVDLRHHARDLHALGDAVAVAAVRGGHDVGVAQVRAHRDGDRLLTGVEVEEAAQLPRRHQLVQLLLEGADPSHAPIGLAQIFA